MFEYSHFMCDALLDLLNPLPRYPLYLSISVSHILAMHSIRAATSSSELPDCSIPLVKLSEDKLAEGCRLGIDSHANTSCAGRHGRVTETYHDNVCSGQPFYNEHSLIKNTHVRNASFAHDTDNGETLILNVNQALDFIYGMEYSLLCSNHARANVVAVDDVPSFLLLNCHSTHSILFL